MSGKTQKKTSASKKKLSIKKTTAKDLSVKQSGKVKGGGVVKERGCSATGETYT